MADDKWTTAGEIDFWLGGAHSPGQIPEHALFMALLIPEGSWKTDASNLYKELESLRVSAASLTLGKRADAAVKATMKLRAYLMALYDRQASGNWTGWAWGQFVDHLRREGDYFVERIANVDKEPQEKELCRWLTFMREHVQFAEHLLDPIERAKIAEAQRLASRFNVLILGRPDGGQPAGCSAGVTTALLALSERAGADLDRYVGSIKPTTRSIIHPALAAHVVREGRRFLDVIGRLKLDFTKQQLKTLLRS